MFKTVATLVGAALLLAACASDQPKGLPAGATLGVADAPKVQTVEYRLSPTDIVEVQVYNVPTLNQLVQLDSAGIANFSLIGAVPAAGKTALELAADLKSRYGKEYLRDPQISVVIKQARVDSFTVDGAVQQPGVFTIAGPTSLIKAIASARGLDPLANPKEVVVFRNIDNKRVAGVFDLNEIRKGAQPDPPIYANDTVVVASSGTRRTLRDIVGVTPLVSLLAFIH
jgi:polysaccharide export outer membrane protein